MKLSAKGNSEMLDEIRVKIDEVEPIIRMRGYNYVPVESQEFLDYMTGTTVTGDKITLQDVLNRRFLIVHELVEMSEVKKRVIPLQRNT